MKTNLFFLSVFLLWLRSAILREHELAIACVRACVAQQTKLVAAIILKALRIIEISTNYVTFPNSKFKQVLK